MDTNPLVPWMDRNRIADRAEKLRRSYQSFSGQSAGPPFPVEALIEQHLGLTLEYDDLEELVGEPDILGALWVEEKRVVIDNRLLDSTEGRFCFTCAHEVGYWTLHRDLPISRGSLYRGGQAAHEDVEHPELAECASLLVVAVVMVPDSFSRLGWVAGRFCGGRDQQAPKDA